MFIAVTETETKIQSAIWELVTTEIDYIHALKTVTDVSMQIFCLFFFSFQSRYAIDKALSPVFKGSERKWRQHTLFWSVQRTKKTWHELFSSTLNFFTLDLTSSFIFSALSQNLSISDKKIHYPLLLPFIQATKRR